MIYIGVDYWRLWVRCKAAEQLDGINIHFEDYTPSRYIFVSASENSPCNALLNMCIEAHEEAQIKIHKEAYASGIRKITFSNKDEAWYWPYEVAKGDCLAPKEISDYSIKIFVDSKLPKEAARDAIDTLGLRNYTVNLGICDERSNNR